jgi:hypothetical protein
MMRGVEFDPVDVLLVDSDKVVIGGIRPPA